MLGSTLREAASDPESVEEFDGAGKAGEVSRVATSDCFFCQSKDEEEAVETGLEDGLHWQYHHTFCSGFRFSPEAKPKEQSGPKDEDEEAFSFGIQT